MTTIILNSEGINALFPEGSEARVVLQRTVLTQLAHQQIRNSSELALDKLRLESAIQEEVRAALRTVGIDYVRGYGGVQLGEKFKDQVMKAAEASVKSEMRDATGNAIREAAKAAVDGMASRVPDLVEAEIGRQVQRRLDAVLALRDNKTGQ